MVKGKDDKDEGDTTEPFPKSPTDFDDQPEILIDDVAEPRVEGAAQDAAPVRPGPPSQAPGPDMFIIAVISNRYDDVGYLRIPDKFSPSSRVPNAYQALLAILQERRQGLTGAWISNFRRKHRSVKRGLFAGFCTLVGGVMSAVLIGEPYSGFAIGATIGAAGPVVVDTNQIRRTKLTELRSEYPDTPEFRDAWAVCCYELMVILNGFNARVDAIQRLIKLSGNVSPRRSSALCKTAREMAVMLHGVRDELAMACEILAQYEPDGDIENVIALPEASAAIKLIDPLKVGKFDWLILDQDTIPVGRELEQLERDRREAEAFAESLKEVADELDPFEALRRKQEEEDDSSDR
jgi:hypothetical protein